MLLWIAAGSAFILACLHTFGGGKQLVPPLLGSKDMQEPVKLVHYYCWHIVTFALFGMAACYAYAAIEPTATILAIAATIFSAFCLVWGFALVNWKKQNHKDMPQWILFVIQTTIGAIAIF